MSESATKSIPSYEGQFVNNGGRIKVELMIDRTGRKDGASQTLIDPDAEHDLNVSA